MNKFIEILIGLIFLIVPVCAWIINFADFGTSALFFLKGGLIWLLIGIGATLLIIGLTELKD